MTSNEDPEGKQAFNQMVLCSLFNSVVPIAMAHTGLIHPYFLAPFMATQFKVFLALNNFRKEKGSPSSAK